MDDAGGGVTLERLLGPLSDPERKRAPRQVFTAGNREWIRNGRRVVVAGSRRATEAELARARQVTETLVSRGVTVVSGLAAGIDTAAHETAIECGGRTVAVLGTPLSQVYPPSNRALQRRIAAEHLLLSEFPEGPSVRPENFARRNRTMALISDAVVIVAAGPRSGTRYLGWEAIRLGRPLAFLEPLASGGIAWIREQIEYGATSSRPDDLASWVDAIPVRPTPQAQ